MNLLRMEAEEYLKDRLYITQDGIDDVHDSLFNVVSTTTSFTRLQIAGLIEEIEQIINEPGEEKTDGECLDEIIEILNKYKAL